MDWGPPHEDHRAQRPHSLPRTHDGFYFRVSAGAGVFWAKSGVPPDNRYFHGGAGQFELAIGGTVGRYVTIGGAYQQSPVFALSSKDDIVDGDEPDLSGVRFKVITVAFFLDVYPDPEKGLHFLGEIGPGWLSTNRQASDPSGLTFALGGGYDWFVADEWSLGVLGRLTVGPYSVTEIAGGNRTDVLVLVPALLLAATYN